MRAFEIGQLNSHCIALGIEATTLGLWGYGRMKCLTLALIGFSSPLLAAEYVLDIKASPTQQSRYEDGREAVDDSTALSTVRLLEPKMQTPKRSGFRIYVANAGQSPFNFGPENICLKLPDGTRVAMLTYQQLVKEEERRAAWAALGAGLAAAGRNMQASTAGYSSGTATFNGYTNGMVGATPYTANTNGFGTFNTYNAGTAFAAQSLANEQNQRDFNAVAINKAARMAELDTLMKMTTVDPGAAFGGIVQYDIPDAVRNSKQPVPVLIEVQVGSETHSFAGTLAKYHK